MALKKPLVLTTTGDIQQLQSADKIDPATLGTGTPSSSVYLRGDGAWSALVDADIPATLTGKTYNGLTLTANATGFSVAGGTTSKTLTISNSITLAGTDGTTITLPSTTGTVPLNNQTMYIGTTAVAINRSSASLALTGITSIDGTAAKATNLVGGNGTTLLGAIPYQSGTDTTTLLSPNTAASIKYLSMTGTGTNGAAPVWSTITMPTSETAGSTTSGYLQYAGTTKTAGQLDGGVVAPTNTTRLNYDGYLYATRFYGDGSQLTGVSGGSVTISDDTTTNATYYPTFYTATSGSMTAAKVASTKLTFNPSTGILYSTEFNSSSDERLKENIVPITSAKETICALQGVGFNWRDGGKKSYGVIAQQVEQVIPDVVTDQCGVKSVNYDAIIGFLIETVKELSAEIEELRARG